MGLFKDILEDRFNPLDAAVAGIDATTMRNKYLSDHLYNRKDKMLTFPDKELAEQQLDDYRKAAMKSRLFGTPIQMPDPIFTTVDEPISQYGGLFTPKMRGVTRNAYNKPGKIGSLFNPLKRGPSQVILRQQEPIKHGSTAVHEYTHTQDPEELYETQFQPARDYTWMDDATNQYLGRGTEIHARLNEIDYLMEVLKAAKPGSEDEITAKDTLSKILHEVRPYVESFTEKYPDTNLSNFNSAIELIRESEKLKLAEPLKDNTEETFKGIFGDL